jgi:hypothetical protein
MFSGNTYTPVSSLQKSVICVNSNSWIYTAGAVGVLKGGSHEDLVAACSTLYF